ncbi:hypothetical protein Hanom_Chr05g00399911 [Helianthus anomalus]
MDDITSVRLCCLEPSFLLKKEVGDVKWMLHSTSFPMCCKDINQENVSKTYLQELFGSFPNNGQDAENSNEEYHIFDGSNSEDEDEDDY